MMNKNKLFNMVFPTYILLFLSPVLIGISLVSNFIIDSILIVVISLFIYKKVNGKFYLQTIFVAWGFGFLADIIGALLCFLFEWNGYTGDKNYLYWIGIIVSSILILFFNYFCTFARFNLSRKQQLFSSLAFAVLTAPYTFLIPENFFHF